MHARYHAQITTAALQGEVSPTALRAIIDANLGQDSLLGLIFHPKYHYDNNLFREGDSYLEDQRHLALTALKGDNIPSAWKAFGRLAHAVQDFYAHTNYVPLWLENAARRNGISPTVRQDDFLCDQIDPLDPAVLDNPALRSGRIYYLLEAINYLPLLSGLARRLSPKDSHLRMNLDGPDRGPLFPCAVSAAQKRTQHEFQELSTIIQDELGPDSVSCFTDN